MPAALTHYIFALDVYSCLDGVDKDYFLLGTQGPDPFFYRGILKKGRPINYKEIWEVGEKLHHQNIAPVYLKMLEKANGDKKLSSFVYGLFLHYCLDKNVHPYVFYRSGFNQEGKLDSKYKYCHGSFESLLDINLSKATGKYTNPGKTINLKNINLNGVSNLFTLFKDPNLDIKTYKESVLDFIHIEKVLFSRSGIKRLLFRVVGKHSLAYAMSYPHFYKRLDYVDVLNLKHNEWKDPCSGEVHASSIFDLMEKAKKEYLDLFSFLLNLDVDNINCYCKKVDHDGTPFGEKKKYCSCCYKV